MKDIIVFLFSVFFLSAFCHLLNMFKEYTKDEWEADQKYGKIGYKEHLKIIFLGVISFFIFLAIIGLICILKDFFF